MVVAWLPALYLTLRTSLLGDFRPMARFGMVTAALSLVSVSSGGTHGHRGHDDGID